MWGDVFTWVNNVLIAVKYYCNLVNVFGFVMWFWCLTCGMKLAVTHLVSVYVSVSVYADKITFHLKTKVMGLK